MSVRFFVPSFVMVLAGLLGVSPGYAQTTDHPPAAKTPADLAGPWEISDSKTRDACRVLLRPQKADNGDFFLGMPPACRHAMPELAKVGRWAMPDPTHLKLDDPAGGQLLLLAADHDAFTATSGDRVYTLKAVAGVGRSAVGFAEVDGEPTAAPPAAIVPVVSRRKVATVEETDSDKPTDLPGRYAVMREKRDTGCMVTLDAAHIKGGERAQLAPGCRDQGIVIFDPTAWQLIKGELVLTARAGHKTHLSKDKLGTWQKDEKDGGKPLGLKRL